MSEAATTRRGSAARWLAGIIADIPTPFDATGALDLAALTRLCERQIEAGASAILVCETAGEASTLTAAEREAVIRTAVEVARGRVHVIAGAGSNSTLQAVQNTRQAAVAGADAVMSVVPYYNRPTAEGIYVHFRAVADATALPVILHDCPSRTGRALPDDTLIRLARWAQFVGLRDTTGDVARAVHLRSLAPPGFRLLSGDDIAVVPFMAAGGDGCFSLMANVAPQLCNALFTTCQRARWHAARRLHRRLLPLIETFNRDAPVALKYALSLEGLAAAHVRLPLTELDTPAKAMLAQAMAQLNASSAGPEPKPTAQL
ncbi:4-hydroxy-tetrahydrodipicolinate synthase [Bradyrhizobium sp. SSBR45G]|uniref:4-hydroxy-tetrahydrodipicolinate synthase n=1 Tax=unclassified Bradyrhizobium TaxID=2631580 RepID=UPI002342990A|nr:MULTISPECIES: 4-hydroxy-tetrahydrodipicolinate synthase [unclassified Bradyrhizobium]GLH79814.1 4-hydroxy-tetrahydrodipicolinate synthase [Bradyrhizobium sp. SSBR45G]GLH87068.1 4-hydroxy-tetrahydrodipicolinate synthase [Bradyrhizobium sp. SSBR45R]